jgi:hypothetical protein
MSSFNPDFAVEIVTRVESAIKMGIATRFFFESAAALRRGGKSGNARIGRYFGLQ